MKVRSALISIFLLCAVNLFSAEKNTLIYHIRLDQNIDKSSESLLVKGLEKAEEAGADIVLLDINTYGGAVDAADSMRAAILHSSRPVVAYVNMQAASAGALISIACDSIFMRPGSSIGAATVVNQSGEVMPDKYQSFMRGMMRATAEANGRDPQIAEAMVDTADVLSMTPEEAVAADYCEGIYDDIDVLCSYLVSGGEYELKSLEDDLTWLDRLIHLLLNPLLQSIFMMMIIGGIFVEIRTPGIGLPLLTALAGALLYFAPAYIGNLVSYWEILLFIAGLILLGIEIFVIPGFGICGIAGVIAVVVSLAFAMIDNSELFNWDGSIDLQPLIMPLGIVIISSAAAVFGSVWLVRRLYNTRSFDHVALRHELRTEDGYTAVDSGLDQYVNAEVEVFTYMRPSGKVKTPDGRIIEAVLKFGGDASKGEILKVVSAEQGRLYCERQ